MTTLEIVDSAVKIGLGAAITAVTTIVVTMLRAHHERHAEISKRRFDLIERLAAEFEQIHSVFIELYGAYATCLDCPNPTAAELSWRDARNCMVKKIVPAVTSLQGLEGRLMLIGALESARILGRYRRAFQELQNEVRMIDGSEGPPPTIAHWQELGKTVDECKTQFFDALRKDYERA